MSNRDEKLQSLILEYEYLITISKKLFVYEMTKKIVTTKTKKMLQYVSNGT